VLISDKKYESDQSLDFLSLHKPVFPVDVTNVEVNRFSFRLRVTVNLYPLAANLKTVDDHCKQFGSR